MSENSFQCFPNVFVRRNQKYIAIKSTTQNVHSWRPCCLEDNQLPHYHHSLRAANQLGNGLLKSDQEASLTREVYCTVIYRHVCTNISYQRNILCNGACNANANFILHQKTQSKIQFKRSEFSA